MTSPAAAAVPFKTRLIFFLHIYRSVCKGNQYENEILLIANLQKWC